MNIGLVAHDSKKKLMQNFCIAYRGILAKNQLFATGTTGRLIEEVANLQIHKYLAGHLGGSQQLGAQIEHNEIDLVIFLRVPAGAYMALVGSSGAGKTTLCSLIPRFYDVTGGCIRVDGKDVRKVTLKSLRDHIGMVQQDVYLFAGTIFENIRYGKPDATREEVIAAAKNANAHEFIMAFPDGYDTDIGQRGIKLSGGQKQRLSIARVFLKNPPVLIFDEATSALDNESERVVQESLEKLAKNRTTFVIAHRLTTIQNAQKILVLTEDGIAESGSHEELLARGGVYEKLYHMHY